MHVGDFTVVRLSRRICTDVDDVRIVYLRRRCRLRVVVFVVVVAVVAVTALVISAAVQVSISEAVAMRAIFPTTVFCRWVHLRIAVELSRHLRRKGDELPLVLDASAL